MRRGRTEATERPDNAAVKTVQVIESFMIDALFILEGLGDID